MGDQDDSTGTTPPPPALSRRRFLGLSGASSAIALTQLQAPAGLIGGLLDPLLDQLFRPQRTLTIAMRRREDFLHLDLDFYNLVLSSPSLGQHALVPRGRGPSYVVVTFPPQHLLERTFFKQQDGTTPDNDPLIPPPVPTRLSGPSRLAFEIPNSRLPLPFTTEALLDWDGWTPQVVPAAADVGIINQFPALEEPGTIETAIELPYWLLLSPRQSEVWRHRSVPTTLAGRTDLWQTSLRPGLQVPYDKPVVQAVWALDNGFALRWRTRNPGPDNTGDPFPKDHVPLTNRDRFDIVQNTSVSRRPFLLLGDPGYQASPFELERLDLSALGASIDGRGQWENPFKNDLIEWSHRGTFGRDHFVRTVRRGYLFPFGQPAVLVRITEREFDPTADGTVAYLCTRQYLVIRNGKKHFAGDAFAQRKGGRELPFTVVDVTTHVTPLLDPEPTDPGGITGTGALDPSDAFVPYVNDAPFHFDIVGTDWAGDAIELTTPMVFVRAVAARDADKMQALRDWYNALEDGDDHYDTRLTKARGQRVAIAETAPGGQTTNEITSFTWEARGLVGGPSEAELIALDQPRFHPGTTQIRVRLAAAEQVTGRKLGSGDGVDIVYTDAYLDGGFGAAAANLGEVYARTLQPHAVAYPGDRSGAVATPDIRIQGLSRVIGPVAGPDVNGTQTIEAGTFDPHDFFMGAEAKILGAILLEDIVESSTDLTQGVPTITSHQDGEVLTSRMHFAPILKADGRNIFKPDLDGNEVIGTMVIDAAVVTNLASPLDSTTTIDGDIRGFTVRMLGTDFPLVDLHFRRLRFHSETGDEGTVEPDIDSVTFPDGSILHFLQELQDLLTFGDSGPAIEVTPTEVSALVTVPIPNIGIGVFSLQNLAFSAGLVIPFTGQPARARFAFCSREDPFLLTVMIFGGGGWLGLGVGLDGLESFEIGLEFGAACSIDLGVASGSIEIMAGIYFLIGDDGSGEEKALIEGYLRLYGEVEVMAIASVSLEAYIGFSYDFNSNKVGGMATVTLTVSVLCFSGSVSVSIERHFGGEGDPTFAQMLPADDGDPAHSHYWNDYCSAFAPSRPQ